MEAAERDSGGSGMCARGRTARATGLAEIFISVHRFDCEHHRSDGSGESGGHACGGASNHNASFRSGQVKQLRNDRSERPARHDDRPFGPERPDPIESRLAILKPLSSAISIGSGGPFGAEGPIIMTGGAIGSMISQLFHLTAAERKTLLVAGAAAGMSATFATPVAAVLLAVELLLFEWKPRSAIPVALASATAGAARRYILGLGPLFPVPQHAIFIGPQGLRAAWSRVCWQAASRRC